MPILGLAFVPLDSHKEGHHEENFNNRSQREIAGDPRIRSFCLHTSIV
jgi:hypothetical protein